MQNWKIKLSLFLNYFVFAILLNSVGTVILQVQNNFGVTEGSASVLEAFKDLSIAIVSFLVSSYITRIGYKRAMLIALGFITIICLINAKRHALFDDIVKRAARSNNGFSICPVQQIAWIGFALRGGIG